MSQPELVDKQGHSYRKFQARQPWPGDEDRSELWVKPATHSWKMLALAAGCILLGGLILAVVLGSL